jgi:hypothetical protein
MEAAANPRIATCDAGNRTHPLDASRSRRGRSAGAARGSLKSGSEAVDHDCG